MRGRTDERGSEARGTSNVRAGAGPWDETRSTVTLYMRYDTI